MQLHSDLKVLVTIDVEEEGLFRGEYPSGTASVKNVRRLALLTAMFERLDIRPTMLVTYQVAGHKPLQDFLLSLRDRWKGEIGAHLHPWNTPPIQDLSFPAPIPSQKIPRVLLQEKLENLLRVLAQMDVTPRSFRMGRFSMGPKMFSLLEQSGILVDSSIIPCRRKYGGPEYLLAPADPYYPDPHELSRSGQSPVLELPVTVLPIIPGSDRLFQRISEKYPASRRSLAWVMQYLGSVSAQPMAAGIKRMKAAVRLHQSRGGRTVVLYFHSSELLPGASPQHPTERHVERFLLKLENFLSWLRYDRGAVSMTLSDLRKCCF